MRYRTRVRTIDAVRWQGQPILELPIWAQNPSLLAESGSALYAYTHNGPVRVNRGDWLILGNKEIYPCTHEEFEKRYEEETLEKVIREAKELPSTPDMLYGGD